MLKNYSKLKKQHGITLLEIMFGVALTLFIISVVASFMYQTWNNNRFVQAQAYLKERMQMGLYRISRQLAQTKRIFNNDAIGTAYLNKLPTARFTTAEKGLIILPTIRPSGSLIKTQTCNLYPDNYFWPLSFGNSLFFAKLVGSFDKFTGLPNPAQDVRNIDIYQFVLYYVKSNDLNQPMLDIWNSTANMRAQYLVEWQSVYYADYNQYVSYMQYFNSNAAARTTVRNQLSNYGVSALWDPHNNNPNTAFYQLQNITAPTVLSSYNLVQKNLQNGLILKNDDILYSIAYNTQNNPSAANFFPLKTNVPTFYESNPTPNATTCGAAALPSSAPTYTGPANAFPGGFEVGIIGPNSGRSIYINMTMVARLRSGRIVEQTHTQDIYARDL